jgi:putative hemolysin
MRLLVLAVAGVILLAGCSSPPDSTPKPSDFDDLGVQATATTGVLLGVVVDQAIRPIPNVAVTLVKPSGGEEKQTTDVQGRFAFDDLPGGVHVVRATHPSYAPVQTTADVVVGVSEPRVLRVLMERLFEQNPYSELLKFDGFLACSISFPVGTTCVNDYTRIVGNTVPGCQGGCLRDYNVSRQGGNVREYVSAVGPGWQQIVFETVWEPSVDSTSPELTISVSYFTRPNAAHFFGGMSGPSPMRLQIDVGKMPPGQQSGNEEPEMIGPEGRDDVFAFFNNGGGAGSITLNQPFRTFQAMFYYGIPPEGWSFVNGDPLPF